MRASQLRPLSRLSAFTLLCLLAISPLFTGKSDAATLAATPAFNLAAGTYTLAQKVTITDATAGATIYYSTSGTPTTASTLYTSGSTITVSASETLEAIAVASGYTQSATATATYTITSPQLEETAVSTATAIVNVGGAITVADTASNLGTAASTANSVTRYYLSATTSKTAGSYLLTGTRTVPALAVSISSAGTATVSVPSGTSHGTYYLLACADDTATVAEINTSNNCMAASTTLVVSGADLEETAVSTTTTAVNISGAISVTDTASNLGQVASAASVTRYYLSATTSKTTSSYLLTGTRAVPALAVAATSAGTATVTVPTGVLHATYYLLACADDTGAAAEINTSNNCKAASTTLVVSGADLEETAVSTMTTAVNISGAISVTDTASNLGQVASAASVTRYYLSATTSKTTSSYLLTGTRAVPALAVAATSAGTATVTVPTGVLHATYYLLACADDTGAAAEINTSNNCKAASTTLVVSGADLEETAVSTMTTAVNISGAISVTDTASNLGQVASAASVTRYYLSATTSKTTSSYLLTGTRAVPALAVAATSAGTATVTVPTGVLHATYYLLACADDSGAAAETNTSNNCKAASTTIVVSGPDLVETTVSTTTTAVNVGGSISVTDTAANIGQVASAASGTYYYLSTTTSKTASSYLLTGGRSVPALAVPPTGNTSTGTVTTSVPEGVLHGTYYLVACENAFGGVVETNTANNCMAASTTIVVSGADLEETAVSAPPASVNIGSSFSVTDTAANLGQVSAGTSTTGYYLSTTTTKTTSSYLLGTRAVPALAAPSTGNTSTGTVTVSVPSGVANGSYHLLACANINNTVDEININNNCMASSAVTVVGTGLQIAGISPVGGTVGMWYAYPMSVSGGNGIYTWSVSAGALPPGLALSPNNITGTPTAGGTYTFTVKVTDTSVPQKTGVATMTITITAPSLTLTLPSTLSLPAATVGQPYSSAINASGTITATSSTYNYIWTVNGVTIPTNGVSDNLPGGLFFTNTGGWTLSIGGTPNIAGPVTFSVTVTACTPSAGGGCQLTSITAGPVSYSITVNSPTALSLPNPLTLPPGTIGQGYSGAINAIGGDRLNYTWTVNGTSVPANGMSLTLSDGIAFSSTGGYTLSIGGTPNAAGTETFTAAVKDVATGATAGPVTYSITTNAPGSQVNGQIYLNNNCGGNSTLPPMTVSINTSPVQTTTTDSNGSFSFQSVPNGTYTVTPSIVGPSSVFYPASQSVTVNGGGNVIFGATLGYTISGTVDYSGSKTGRIYLALNNNYCGGTTSGTSISAKGSFTIRGVPPGTYTLQAWMDNLGYGAPNASNPAGSTSGLTVSTASLTGLAVTLNDPAAVTLSSAPTLQLVSPYNAGAFVQYKAIQTSGSNNNGNSVELATSYTLEWSTSSTFTTTAGSKTFAATGANGNNIWFIDGLSEGSIYYFRAQGVTPTSTGPWSSSYGPVTITSPVEADTVQGSVTFTGTPTGPLYVGFYDQSTNNVYATAVKAPVSPQAFTIEVPTGSNYCFFGILDQNNDGMIDAGDIQNAGGNCPTTVITASVTGKNLTLPSANSTVSLTTQHQRQTNSNGTSDYYQLNFNVNGLIKQPVAVALLSGPNAVVPMDVGQCTNCGGSNGSFSFWLSLNATPAVGDAYSLQVTYSDGTSDTLTAKVGTVLSAFATAMSPAGSSATVTSVTPTFTWTDPASPSSYTYQFSLWDNNGNQIWQIPGNNSKSNGFSSSVTSIVWGTDPTGGGSTPSVASLTTGAMYNWQIQAQDANGNSAQMQVSYQPGGELPLTLPSPNPSTLGPAIVGQSYGGMINASGGSTCYGWTVTGLSDNLNWGSTCTALTIGGTPSTSGTVTFQVTVMDNQSHSYGPVTYTINVAAPAPLSFNTTQSQVPVALLNSPYDLYLSASGGVPPYTFTTASGTVPPPLSYLSTYSGLVGTPTTAGSYTFAVKVTDSASNTATSPSLTVTVASGPAHQHDAWLNGTYVCQVMGFYDSDSTFWSLLSSFPATGVSTYSGGVLDKNSSDSGPVSGTLAGTVNIGADNTGLMTFTVTPTTGSPNTFTYAVTLNSLAAAPATEFHGVEIDDVGASPSGQHSMASCYRATTTAFALSSISGHSFAFNMGGVSGSGAPKETVGQFVAASGGLITSGEADSGKGYENVQSGTLNGTYTTPNATSGRYTMALTQTVNGTVNGTADFVSYIIDAKRQLILMFDAGDGPSSGNVRTQQQASYSNANLNGPFVMYSHGHQLNSSTDAVDGFESFLFQGSGNGTAGLTINQSYSDNVNTLGLAGSYGVGCCDGPYSIAVGANGRALWNTGGDGGADNLYMYFYDNSSALIMEAGGTNLGSAYMEAQTLPTITDTTLAGSYEWGTLAPLASFIQDDIGEYTLGSLTSLTAAGSFTGTSTSGQQYEFSWDSPFSSATYAWSSTAQGTFLIPPSSPVLSCIYVTDTPAPKFVCISNTSSKAEVDIAQQ